MTKSCWKSFAKLFLHLNFKRGRNFSIICGEVTSLNVYPINISPGVSYKTGYGVDVTVTVRRTLAPLVNQLQIRSWLQGIVLFGILTSLWHNGWFLRARTLSGAGYPVYRKVRP